MSRFKTKQELIDDIVKERALLEALLDEIPAKAKLEEVTDGMSVKDFLAHRTEWGRMVLSWYTTAKKGGTPAVPSEKYKWNQLKELNAEIHRTYKKTQLKKVEADFKKVHDTLFRLTKRMSDDELFRKKYYAFTGNSDLALYMNASTASHYRSARRHIAKWWRKRNPKR